MESGVRLEFFGSTTMEVNGLRATLNMPAARKKYEPGLPPYAPRPAYVVQEYEKSPDYWEQGSAKESSYFIPVRPGHGMWLDFNDNLSNPYHVAVLLSIQGVNPLTGQKQEGFTLQQHKDNCPVHKEPFGQDRFCKSCDYKWEPQNYLASNAQKNRTLWLDGWYSAPGEKCQYVFTEETIKSVAASLIGDARMYAIGIAFFLSKEPKPKKTVRLCSRDLLPMGAGAPLAKKAYSMGEGVLEGWHSKLVGVSPPPAHAINVADDGHSIQQFAAGSASLNDYYDVERSTELNYSEISANKKIEVGRGAKIDQPVEPDPENLDFWQPEPAGFIYINYCDEMLAYSILNGGKRDLTKGGKGFLAEVPCAV